MKSWSYERGKMRPSVDVVRPLTLPTRGRCHGDRRDLVGGTNVGEMYWQELSGWRRTL
jgi:hypothetical protein